MEIRVVRDVMEKNRQVAGLVRQRLAERRSRMLNLMGSPGSGKTSLLEKLIPMLIKRGLRVAVVEGDTATMNDAVRLSRLEIPVCHVNTRETGSTCHIPANVMLSALDELSGDKADLIILENVGNLVCPAECDPGAHLSAVLLSVAEGEDKPLKYPQAFKVSGIGIIGKIDLAGVLETDLPLLRANMLDSNPEIEVVELSAKSGKGLEELGELLVERLGLGKAKV